MTPTSVDETSPRLSIAKAANGAPEINALINSCKDLKSYKFYSLMTVAKGKKLVENAGTFFFKAPGLMRVEVDGHGPKAGSKLVRNAQGKIRVKGGPALLGITMNIEPDSRLLTLPNGRLLTQCDFLSLVQGLAKEIATGEKATVSSAPVNLTQEPGTKAIVLETQEPGQDANLINQRILIDPKMNVPIRWFGFKNGQLIYSVKFEDLKINPDIADDMFNL